jgi:hypothetical protein
MYCFPFGSPLRTLRQDPIASPAVFVLGVYASAVHARWLNLDGTTRVAALAVASEPEIFWRGEGAERIIGAIPVPPAAGRLVMPAGRMNGPSGVALDRLYLTPLGLDRERAWLCDLLPESRLNPNQLAAVAERYAPLAARLGLPVASVPPAPSRFASRDRAEEIAQEFLASGARTLITLGDAPLREFVHALGLSEHASLAAFGVSPEEYGQRHAFKVDGRAFDLLPLAHPRQAARLGAHSQLFASLHERWVERLAARHAMATP